MHSARAPASETLAAIQALQSVAERLSPRNIALPAEPESARMLRALGAMETAPAPPPADFLEDLRRRLAAASRAGMIGALLRKELRYAPWLLWNGTPPAVAFPGLLATLLEQAGTSTATLRRLIGAYLRDFNPRAPGIDEAAARIREVLARGEPRFTAWRTAQSEVRLFDPARGPAALAELLLGDDRPEEILVRCRLHDEMLATGKFMAAVEDAVRAAAPLRLRNQAETGLRRLLRIVAPNDALRFRSRVADTARALLRAWLDGGPQPVASLQQPVREVLLRWLGDPRLRPQQWAALGDQEAALMRRWLTRASLDLFFKLIDRHALDQHWRYRHSFWLAYLEKGAISDAWLVLGSRTFSEAETVRDLGKAYGRLKGATADQSALLLRIGPLVIGEFTHNGSLRAWPADWPDAPRLGCNEYSSLGLKKPCLPFPPNPYWARGGETTGKGLSHFNSSAGYWQGSAAALIEHCAGFRITASDWRPR
jgi:hypothetical protein